jgi:hypothetical protein
LLGVNVGMAYSNETVTVARWFRDYQGAVSLRFDDGFESQRKIAVPLLNQYDFKATFMVNPARERYKANVTFWETELPKMGHRLGNHTMHHNGARTIEEADYEIGEVSRRIWKVYDACSKLNVFASGGGGQTWGGKSWSAADEGYKKLMEKYHLIDLYDGHHKSYGFHAKTVNVDIFEMIRKAIEDSAHQPFHFHEIEENWMKNIIKGLLYGANLNIDRKQLIDLLERLHALRATVWVAPLIDILKYEEERKQTRVEPVVQDGSLQKIRIRVDTDAQLYDHPLTLIFPARKGVSFDKAFQNNKTIPDTQVTSKGVMLNITPVTSEIYVHSRQK